jgi:preprotein translocase subunit YajC
MGNAATGYSAFSMLFWCAVLFGIMYFFMIRPNKKRMEEYKKMLSGLKVGDRIIFAGGIYGTIRAIDDESLRVEISDGVIVEVPKSAVANLA